MFEHTGMIRLTQLYDGPDNINKIYRSSEWLFDNDEQFLGVLEDQARLLEEWVIDWMLGEKYVDLNIYKLLDDYYSSGQKWWDSATEEEQDKRREEVSQSANQWRKTRFFPKKWKLEDLDKK